MHNRITNIFEEKAGTSSGNSSWDVDHQPALRIACLFFLVLIPFGFISFRLIQLQLFMGDVFADEFETLTESFEPIPGLDGRILGSNGKILAYDKQYFDIHIEYRWLEEPSNERWLLNQALSLLDRKDWKNKEKVKAAKDQIYRSRMEMWETLAALSGLSSDEIEAKRKKIQDRVEKIIALVEKNRAKKQKQTPVIKQETEEQTFENLWDVIVKELTTPPHRSRKEKIIIKEELLSHQILKNIEYRIAAEIDVHPRKYSGLSIKTATERIYSGGSIAAHIIGSRSRIDVDEIKKRTKKFPDGDPLAYRDGDNIGRSGIEKTYDQYLHGRPGQRKIVKNRRGEIVRKEIVRQPINGQDIELTLNLTLQEIVETKLDNQLSKQLQVEPDNPSLIKAGASAVVLDIHTCAVITAASAPRFDPTLIKSGNQSAWKQYLADPRQPFFHRSIQMTLPPGSVFKSLSSVALLESNLIDPDAGFFCQGYLNNPKSFRCYIYRHGGYGHGEMTLSDAICRSCNVYFFHAADKIGHQPIVKWAEIFGFGQLSGIDLPGEKRGHLPTPENLSVSKGKKQKWHKGDTRLLAIGQSRLTVTPIQIARMMAIIANGGYDITPRIGIPKGVELEVESPSQRESRRIRQLSDGTLEMVQEGLRKVVENERGTGYRYVRMKQISIAGKTGTAEVGGGRKDHAWFAGYVPADRPRYAFAVVVEHGGSGGKTCGPVVRELVQGMLDLGLLYKSEITQRD